MVLQDVFLLNGTVAENIVHGSPGAEWMRLRQLPRCQSDEFIRDARWL